MSIELVTGYAGEGHISSADAGRFNAGICGRERRVLNTGTMFEATVISNNLVRIGSGDAVDQGRHITLHQNSTEDAAIQNGEQGKTRIDTICLEYSKDASTGVESADVVVVRGTAVSMGSTPTAPTLTSGNIYNGAMADQMPLYNVLIENTEIVSVTKVYTAVPSLSDIYPVGSIYMNVNNVNPAELFGGIWTEIHDRFLLGRASGGAGGEPGGNKTVVLTTNNLPAHTHKGPSHTHSTPNHTHSASCASAGSHKHTVARYKVGASGTARWAAQANSKDGTTHDTSSNGSHSHTITVASGGGGTTGAAGTGNTGSTGSGQAVSIMPPYITVYMWQRTG